MADVTSCYPTTSFAANGMAIDSLALCKDIMQSPCESADLSKHEEKIRCWGVWSVALELSEQQYAGCFERGKGLGWTDMTFEFMKRARKHSPHRLPVRGEVEGHGNAGSL